MPKSLSLFDGDNLKIKSVSRFYHIDYYYFVLFSISNGAFDYDSIFNFVVKNKDKLSSIANTLESRQKYNSDYQIISSIRECILFELVSAEESGKLKITPEGKEVLKFALEGSFETSERILCQKVELHFGRFSQLILKCHEINPKSRGLVVFPKPSPKILGYRSKDILEKSGLSSYCRDFAEYASKDISKYMHLQIDSSELRAMLSNKLTSYVERSNEKGLIINLTREVKQIAYSYYLKVFFDSFLERASFDIWLRRAREFRLMNFSEFFPGVNSMILYPVSVILPREPMNLSQDLLLMTKTKSGQGYITRYKPTWETTFKELFLKTLWDNYNEISELRNSFFISVQDLRDVVCFKLQISELSFTDYLSKAYLESMNETIKKFKISLEVDRAPEEREFVYSKRYPILINQIPKNIIGIKMR